MELKLPLRMSGATLVYVINAIVFAIPPWHEHDLMVSWLFVVLVLYEIGVMRPVGAGDTNG